MIVYKEYYINSARFLPKLDSSHICSNLHGHTYNIKVSVKGPVNPNTGFVIDAFDIDKYFAKVHKEIDHKLLNEIKGLENPTSENICVFVSYCLPATTVSPNFALFHVRHSEAKFGSYARNRAERVRNQTFSL